MGLACRPHRLIDVGGLEPGEIQFTRSNIITVISKMELVHEVAFVLPMWSLHEDFNLELLQQFQ